MSLIHLLNNDCEWQKFLVKKKENSHLPKKVLDQYETFINEKKYKDIVEEIINNDYTFSIPKKVLIGKMGKSKKRIVYTFNTEENYILKMITFLLYKYDHLFSPNLYSFRQNSGVKKAIFDLTKRNKINNLYAYKVDIKNYFNSINIDMLLDKLKEDMDDLFLYNILEKILRNEYVEYKGSLIKEQKGVMAGVPISAFLSNYYLKDLDKYFFENNILYIRYADDIIVFADTLELIEQHKKYIVDYLKSVDLEINKDKEYLYKPKEKISFLGFSCENGVIDLNDNTIKKIKGKIRRSARGLRRWMIRKDATYEVTLKAMNRKFNRKFFGKNENDLTWRYWFFPTINTSKSLKIVDEYMQEWQRYIKTGKHNKKNYEKIPYAFLKQCNYKSLVNEYYKQKQQNPN